LGARDQGYNPQLVESFANTDFERENDFEDVLPLVVKQIVYAMSRGPKENGVRMEQRAEVFSFLSTSRQKATRSYKRRQK
jgi:hypothetical protein